MSWRISKLPALEGDNNRSLNACIQLKSIHYPFRSLSSAEKADPHYILWMALGWMYMWECLLQQGISPSSSIERNYSFLPLIRHEDKM